MEGSSRFVRLVLFFDLPQETKTDQRHYRQFVKYLKTEDDFIEEKRTGGYGSTGSL